MSKSQESVTAFIRAACVPRDAAHGSGTLDAAEAIRAAHPDVATASIHTAAILGDESGVRRFLARDPGAPAAKGGPHGWDALTHLCFSRYLRLDPARSAGFVGTARALLDAGASASTGWFEKDHEPRPVFESALYGAAGIARHTELTRLLLERGADPNDEETPYHSPETYDNGALRVLVECGRLSPDSLATMLIRKADWHDRDGMQYLLEKGADPNRMSRWGRTALHQAILRDNELATIEMLLDHGADPKIEFEGRSSVALAARRGRGGVLAALERRGVPVEPRGPDRLIAACARNDAAAVRAVAAAEPESLRALLDEGGRLLAAFSGAGNTEGVKRLLDLGVPAAALFEEGDGYFDVAPKSTALHVAAWRARPAVVKLLIERGADVGAKDGKGRTALSLAVRACVDSHWTELRSPESVEALLRAGARTSEIRVPSGYAEIDELLRRHGAKG